MTSWGNWTTTDKKEAKFYQNKGVPNQIKMYVARKMKESDLELHENTYNSSNKNNISSEIYKLISIAILCTSLLYSHRIINCSCTDFLLIMLISYLFIRHLAFDSSKQNLAPLFIASNYWIKGNIKEASCQYSYLLFKFPYLLLQFF